METASLERFYRQLLETYGPQGWWPLYLSAPPPAYLKTPNLRPENDRQRLEIVLGAVLTQNTAWTNVTTALARLGQAGLLGLEELLAVPGEELAQVIRPAGYFNQKAIYLKELAWFFTQHPFDSLTQLDRFEARLRLLSVKGVGEETADCILLYALGHPCFVIDAYTRRILLALGLAQGKEPYRLLAQGFEEALPLDFRLFQEYHGLLVAHGKAYYSKKPYPKLDPLAKGR